MDGQGNVKKASMKRSRDNEQEELITQLQRKMAEMESKLAEKESELALEKETSAKMASKLEITEAELALEKKTSAKMEKKIFKYSLRNLVLHPTPTINLNCLGTSSSHTHPKNHLKATPQCIEIQLEVLTEEMFSKDVLDLSSRFLREYFGNEEKPKTTQDYTSEADISSLVQLVLRDVIDLVGDISKSDLSVFHQMSLFSQSPDHLVVRDSATHTPILVVEDKKPYRSLASKPLVMGQIYDYLKAMQTFANTTPFSVLSTFEKSIMLWQHGDESENIATSTKGRFKQIIKGNEQPQCSRLPVPDKLSQSPPKLQGEQESQFDLTFSLDDTDSRKLWHSSEYDTQDIVRLFFTAMICGLVRNKAASRIEQIILPTKPFTGEVLKLVADEKAKYSWGRLKMEAVDQGDSVPVAADSYYATGVIGTGSTSKVFIGLDGYGRQCVIKMFVNRLDSENISLNAAQFSKKAKESTEREAKVLKEIYPYLVDKVYDKRISGIFCVVMPFFKPIGKDDRRKPEFVTGIQNALKHLYSTQNKKYNEGDICWHHVGMYEKKVVLFDLADLVALEDDEFVEEVATKHWQILFNRAGSA